MARDLAELLREAAALPEQDRATLAGLLIESLEPEPNPTKFYACRELRTDVDRAGGEG